MFRTLRSRYRRIVPALIGSVAIVAAVLLAQSATESKGSAAPQLAAAERSADGTASRGSARTADGGLALQIAQAAQNGDFGSPQDAADATTTTTEAPTTTSTTAAPTTTAKPKPVVTEAPKPKPTTPPATQPPNPPATGSDTSVCALADAGAWCSVAKCESGDRNANTGNGFYGYFQFTISTWNNTQRAYLGNQYPGNPNQYGASVQLAAAKALRAHSGAGQWPVCGKYVA